MKDFEIAYEKEIEEFEERIVCPEEPDPDKEIANVEQSIRALAEFKTWSKANGGAKYFADTWEHCFNSQCSDFRFEDRLKSRLKHAEVLKEASHYIVKAAGEGVLQKDLSFEGLEKNEVSYLIKQMADSGTIKRTKEGRTYRLSL
jgi:hypothetical protein